MDAAKMESALVELLKVLHHMSPELGKLWDDLAGETSPSPQPAAASPSEEGEQSE